MANITGTLTVEHAGKTIALRLTFGAMDSLQEEFGPDVAGLLSGSETPNFKAMLRMIELAIAKGTPSLEGEAKAIADDIASIKLVHALVAAAFPEAQDVGNGKKPKAA